MNMSNKENNGAPKAKQPRGRKLAIKEGRVGSRVRYSKRVEKMLEQLARGFN